MASADSSGQIRNFTCCKLDVTFVCSSCVFLFQDVVVISGKRRADHRREKSFLYSSTCKWTRQPQVLVFRFSFILTQTHANPCSSYITTLDTSTLSVCCTDLITEHATRDVMMGNSLSRSQEKHDSPSSTAVLSLRISGRSRMKRECAVDTRLSHNVVIIDVHTDTHHGETLVLRAGTCDYQKSNRPLDKVEEEEDEGG